MSRTASRLSPSPSAASRSITWSRRAPSCWKRSATSTGRSAYAVSWTGRHPFLRDVPADALFYFVHSFAPDPNGAAVGETEHGRPFAAAVASGNVFATQFHPEKSGEAGLRLYEAFVLEAAA